MTVALRYEFVSLASDEDDGAGNRIQLDYDVVFNNVKVRIQIRFSVIYQILLPFQVKKNHYLHPSLKENIENSESYFITTGVTITNGDTDEVKADLFDVNKNENSHC